MKNFNFRSSLVPFVVLPLALLLGLAAALSPALLLSPPAFAGSDTPAATDKPTAQFEFVKPIVEAPDCEEVLATMQNILKALEQGDLDKFGTYLDDDAYLMDAGSKTLTEGKQAVIARFRKEMQGAKHLVRLKLYDVFPQVVKDRAIITSSCTKEYDSNPPEILKTRTTDVFVKKDGQWKLVEHHTNWKK
jgi:ketosteroid isomerase-like protein